MRHRFKLITASRVITGRHDGVIEGVSVLVDDRKIVQIGTRPEIVLPPAAEVERADFPGCTLLPGLIDVHTHFNYAGDGTHTDVVTQLSDDDLLLRSVKGARTHLHRGVTTIRECGAKNDTAFALRRGIEAGVIEGPRMLVCGRPLTITGGHMWQMGGEADGIEGMRRAVRQLVKDGADWIKIAATGGTTSSSLANRPSFTVDELRAAVVEAHNLARLVATHCLATTGIVNSLTAGVDMIIHAKMRDSDGMWLFDPKLAEDLARSGVPVNLTLHIARARLWAVQEAARDNPSRAVTYGRETLDVESVQRDNDMLWLNSARLLESGVKLIAGSDAGFGWYPLGEFWRELECLTQIGMTPVEAIASATQDAAEAIGLGQKVGSIELEKEADLLVVQGDPSQDISALSNVEAVYLAGQRIA